MARVIQTADILPTAGGRDKDWIYNGLDCCVTLEVLHAIKPQLDNVSSNTYGFSRDLQGPILDMTTRGVRVDQRRRVEVLDLTRSTIDVVERQLERLLKEGVGIEINWRSPQQLGNLFYDVMQLKEIKKRAANGGMSRTTNRDAIEKLSHYFIAEPFCLHLLCLRELDKKRQFLETGIDRDGRIRTNFNIAGTNTGRLASSMSDLGTGTNMQNVDRALREIFIADPGYKFCNIDLEQGDARNVGAILWNTFFHSHGPTIAGAYLDACESGDLHTTVCRMAWSNLDWSGDARKTADQIGYRTFSYRDLAKKLGHGTNYYGLPHYVQAQQGGSTSYRGFSAALL